MPNISRFNPFEFEDAFRNFFRTPAALPEAAGLKIKLDVKEDDKTYTVHADIPGVKKEDIQVEVKGDAVAISAEVKKEKEEKKGEKTLHSERYYGRVSRSFTLPTEIDEKGTVAKYKDGVLDLTLPKKSGGASSRIAIQ
jgi:HSP20 family protein